mmetsp:Transcript_52583/g.96915  ORF Transcript_52583/g.96915 Transcript_52583/m.96915 type:complete len:674 (-) Transcript_52583:51-2072(-)
MAMVVHSFFALALAVLAFVPSIATDCKSEVFSEDGTDETAACFMQQHAAIKVNRHDHEVKMTDVQPKDKEKQKPTPTLIPGAGELGAFNPSTNGLTDWDKQFISDKYGGPFYDGQDKIPAFKSQGEVRKNIAMGDDDTTPPPAPTTAAPTKAATEAAAEEKKEAAPTAAPVVQAKKKVEMSAEEQAQEVVGSRVAILTALFGLGSCILIYLFLLEPGENRFYFRRRQTHPLPGWGIASWTICVFCSYLIISSVRNLVAAMLPFGTAKAYPLTLDTFLLFGYFAIFHWLMFKFKEDWFVLEGISHIGAFVMGFAGTDTMGSYFSTQRCFSGTLLSSLSTVCITLMILALGLVLLTVVRANIHDSVESRLLDTHQARTWDAWHETSKRCDNLTTAIALGYLGMQCVSYAQSGKYYPMHARPMSATPYQAGQLLFTAFIFGTIFFVVMYTLGHHQDRWRNTHRFQVWDLARSMACMATSWCALSACGWLFWSDSIWFWSGGFTPGKAMTAALLSACAVSIVALPMSIAIIHSDLIRRLFFQVGESFGLAEDATDGEGELYGTKDVVTGLGLAMGVSWGSAFVLAARAWGTALARANPYLDLTVQGPVFQAFICLALCAWILPAWAFHIMPLSVGHQKSLYADLKETSVDALQGFQSQNFEDDARRMMGSVLPRQRG